MKRLLVGTGVIALACCVGVALANAPEPRVASAYDNFRKFKSAAVGIFLVTSAADPLKLNGGPATYRSGPEGSSGTIVCSGVALKHGFTEAVAEFGFPGTRLKLSHGRYAFYVKWTSKRTAVVGGAKSSVTLHLELAGTVQSATVIKGRLVVRGGGCTTHAPLPYVASLDRSFPLPAGS